MKFFRDRSASLSMVVPVLCIIAFLQGGISYTISYGRLHNLILFLEQRIISIFGIGLLFNLFFWWMYCGG